jgi:hypothetical protein
MPTLVVDTVAPAGPFPGHVDTDGKGGYRAVADVTARDAIPAYLRSEGMLVRLADTGVFYYLDPDLTTWHVAFSGGGSSTLDVAEVRASSNAGQTVTDGSEAVQYEDETVDTDSAWDFDEYVAPFAGPCVVTATVDPNSSSSAFGIRINVNGTNIQQGGSHPNSGYSAFVTVALVLAAGDVLQVRTNHTVTRDTTAITNTIHILQWRTV